MMKFCKMMGLLISSELTRSYAVGVCDLLLQLTNSWLVKEACVGNERGD